MKLHLPKLLLSAVLATCVAPVVHALSVEVTDDLVDYTIDATKSFAGHNVTYTVEDNKGTISGLSTDSVTYTFTFDRVAAKTTEDAALMYVTNGTASNSARWGLHVYDGNSDGKSDIVGHWFDGSEGGAYDTSKYSDIDSLTSDTVTARIFQNNVTQSDGTTKSGTYLYKGTDTTVSEPYYIHSGLFTSTGAITTAVFNTDLVKTITVKESQLMVSADGVSKTLIYADTAVLSSSDNETKHEVKVGNALLKNGLDANGEVLKKNIVVTGTTQLFLQSWNKGANLGELTMERDIYIGQTSYTEGDYSNAAIRFGNDAYSSTNGGNTINVEGDIYVMEDAIMVSSNSNTINIKGAVTDIIDGAKSGSILTVKGEGYNFSGDIDLSALSVNKRTADGAAAVTISSKEAQIDRLDIGTNATLTVTGALTVGSTVSNRGTIDLSSGSVKFEDLDAEHYDGEAYYNRTGDGKTVSANGYTDTSKLLLAGGNVTITDSTQITGTGLASWENVAGTGLVGTLANGGFDNTTFYVNSGTVRLSTKTASSDGVIYSDNTATTYVVKSGATLDVYFKASEFSGDYALVDRTIRLEEGATLTNTGDNGSMSLKQLHKIELTGDATVNATVNATSNHTYGFLAASYGKSTLTLNGHTLEKTGNGEFRLLNTTVTDGTIKITEGTVRAVRTNSNASATDLVLNGAQNRSANLAIDSGITLSAKSISGTGNINGGGQLNAGSVQLDGSLSLTGATLKTSTLTKADGTLTIGEGGVLDIRTMHSNLAGGYNGGASPKLNDLLSNLADVSTSGNGYVWATGCTDASYTSDDGNINLQENAELSTRLVLTNNLGINGKAWQTKGVSYSLSINEGGELQVGNSGTGTLSLVTGAKLAMTNSSVTAGAVVLGHDSGTATQTEDGKAFYYHGTITMSGEKSKLKVDKITFNGSAANAVTITGGEVEFTNTGNIQDSIIKGADSNDAGTVTINDTRMIANNSWALKSDNNAVNIVLTDVTFDIAAEKTVTLDGSQVKIGGSNTVEGGGKLAFGGDVTTYMKDDEASISVSSGSELTWAGGDISVTALGEQTPATVSGSIIDSADINVSTDSYIEIEQAVTGNSNLSVNEGLLAFIGVDTLEIHDLMVKSGAQVKVGSSDSPTSSSSGSVVKVTGTANLSGGATVSGLNLNNATALTLNGIENDNPVKVNGEFSMNTGTMSLDGDIRDKLAQLEAGWQQALFSVSSFTLNGESVTGNLTAESGALSLDMVFKDCDFGADYYLGYLAPEGDAGGIIYIGRAVPEPATATLSLLALAGLAARRRRK